ncbi:hypothetical protein CSKR_102124 [Clonorchis sinensis]|uniref:Uncharacterized protein n=1 Tax=Clonorchis sinensis TaxID=79923 RepID=A0A419Q9R1_CLOSI|nr:hypothetical protein CSKR_102124 [Clonorchis sinensis]
MTYHLDAADLDQGRSTKMTTVFRMLSEYSYELINILSIILLVGLQQVACVYDFLGGGGSDG